VDEHRGGQSSLARAKCQAPVRQRVVHPFVGRAPRDRRSSRRCPTPGPVPLRGHEQVVYAARPVLRHRVGGGGELHGAGAVVVDDRDGRGRDRLGRSSTHARQRNAVVRGGPASKDDRRPPRLATRCSRGPRRSCWQLARCDGGATYRPRRGPRTITIVDNDSAAPVQFLRRRLLGGGERGGRRIQPARDPQRHRPGVGHRRELRGHGGHGDERGGLTAGGREPDLWRGPDVHCPSRCSSTTTRSPRATRPS